MSLDGTQELTPQTHRDRPDTIRCIVASLVGDGESGDSLVDENEPIQPLQQVPIEDFSDANWEPDPVDAGPGPSCVHFARPALTNHRCSLPCEQAQ